MSQVEVAKLTLYTGIIPDADAVTVPKMSIYLWLTPGDDTGELPDRQSFVYAQTIRRS